MITGAETVHLVARPPLSAQEGRLPMLDATAAKGLGLHDGQVVRPTVETRGTQLMLMVGGQAVLVPPDWRAVAAQQPWWRVHFDVSRAAWMFRPLSGHPAEGGASTTAHMPALMPTRSDQLAVRPPTLSSLLQLLSPGFLAQLFQAAPQAEISPLLAQFQRLLPSMSRLTPEQLRHWAQHSGFMGEALLAKGQLDQPDMKQLLRAIMRAWTQAPMGTRQLLSEAIDDIESRQLHNAESSTQREGWVHWVLAFADFDPVHVRFNHPKTRLGQGDTPLVVHLHTRSARLGDLWLQTRITHQTQVDLVMWAEQATVAASAQQAAPSLTDWLESSGLDITGMQVIHGVRPALDAETPSGEAGQILDLKA